VSTASPHWNPTVPAGRIGPELEPGRSEAVRRVARTGLPV
jgi:hypothetical protein